jgi:RNA-directed DNA polymerase
VISPLLANIYLHELDRYMESKYLNLSDGSRQYRRRKGIGNYLYVRYADDFVVLCNGTKAEALAMKEELKEVLSTMGLTLSEEKTKVTHITEGFTFLGYEIIRSMGLQGKLVPKVRIPHSAMQRFKHKVRKIVAPGTTQESGGAKVLALNQLIRGWCHYYRNTSRPSIQFRKLRGEVYWGMADWLAKKYDQDRVKILRKYSKGSTFTVGNLTLVMPTDFKAQKLLTRKWHNPYTAKEEIKRERLFFYENLWYGSERDRKGWMDLREEVIQLKGTVCALNLPDICESKGNPLHPSEVEVHHAPKPRAWSKDKMEADRMKHLLPVCTSCHRAQTKTDLKVLSRMR